MILEDIVRRYVGRWAFFSFIYDLLFLVGLKNCEGKKVGVTRRRLGDP